MTENPSLRPAPDDFLTIIRRQQLGKLKIYLGPCPGVGKTYQMLIEGNRLRRQGVDVVIGYVEPHDRPETTAQIGDLEIVPPLVAKYHGITLKEMDLDAVLARKPGSRCRRVISGHLIINGRDRGTTQVDQDGYAIWPNRQLRESP